MLHNIPLDTQPLDPKQARHWVSAHPTRYNQAFSPLIVISNTHFTHTSAKPSASSMDGTQVDLAGELRVRSYQAEMLDRSLGRNVIVAVLLFLPRDRTRADRVQMDTGSGKTAM